jgi:hypothetical protein
MLYYDSSNPEVGAFAAPQPGIAEEPISEAEWQALKPPPPPQPNWAGYLISMIGNTLWRQWVDGLPPHHALATTGAAQRENAAMLQATFNAAALAIATPDGARAAWQAIADANNIAVDFEGS